MRQQIYFLNGPNLNLLGSREPEIYGAASLEDIQAAMQERAGEVILSFRQTNSEGTLVDWVQEASQPGHVLIINAGAYTHTSIALHDALRACEAMILEVHISNPAARESFREVNYVAPTARGSIAGFGIQGYLIALDYALEILNEKRQD